jgi:glutamate synthase (NADPH) small chain
VGELGGFLKRDRRGIPYRDPAERLGDFREFVELRPDEELADQGARCMECGVPFCHNGCPLGNLIPDWNDLVFRGRWQEAIKQLHATNNFPEFTGRLCPAPCEAACVLEIREGDAVTIKQIELSIIDKAWEEGWVVPCPPTEAELTGKTVAVVGAGPAGLAAAQQLRRDGHEVTLFERDESPGGLIRFGVPDFKIEKWVIDRRVQQIVDEGVELRLGTEATPELLDGFDAVVLATGSRTPRDLPAPGRELSGIHSAMEFLYVRNREVAKVGHDATVDQVGHGEITAKGKRVVVIGGGDTGADCVANSLREGAVSVVQLEVLPEPPERRPDDKTPWPLWPQKYRMSYAMEEGHAVGKAEQTYAITTLEFVGDEAGGVRALRIADSDPKNPFGPHVEGTERELEADLVLLAMGFLHPEPELLDGLGLDKDARGNVKAPTYAASRPGVFAAGDCRRGQSLIVWAINEGRQAARMVDRYLRDGEGRRADVDGSAPRGSEAAPPQVASGAMPVGR